MDRYVGVVVDVLSPFLATTHFGQVHSRRQAKEDGCRCCLVFLINLIYEKPFR